MFRDSFWRWPYTWPNIRFQTYMNSDVPTLIRALLTGGEANELESLLTEGVGLVRRQTIARRDSARRRCSLTLLSLDDPLLANVDVIIIMHINTHLHWHCYLL